MLAVPMSAQAADSPSFNPATDIVTESMVAPDDTRAAGHNVFGALGVRVYTDDSSSAAKAAGYFDVNTPLADVGEPSMDWINNDPATNLRPSVQLRVDIDGDGTRDGTLVGEPTYADGSTLYGDNWWLSAGSSTQQAGGHTDAFKALAPSNGGGFGSSYNGTLDQWRAAIPNAEVLQSGWSLGSGVKGDGTIYSITVGEQGYYFRASVPAASSHTVRNADVKDEETSSNYSQWHQGYANATARHEVNADGLTLAGQSQVMKGYTNNSASLNTRNADLRFALQNASYTVKSGSDPVTFQVPLFFDDDKDASTPAKFTTLRNRDPQAGTNTFKLSDNWQSSKAIGSSIAANTDAPLDEIISALGNYKVIGVGVQSNAGATGTVSDITFDNVSYTFSDPADVSTTDATVKESDIAPDESTYAGWHQGATEGTATVDNNNLQLHGTRSQVIKGYANNGSTLDVRNVDLRELVRTGAASYTVESGTAVFQIAMFFEDPENGATKFTTLRPTNVHAGLNTINLGDEWTTTTAIGDIVAKDGSTQLSNILSAVKTYKVLAFGVFANNDAEVSDITWDGVKYNFKNADPTGNALAATTRANDSVKVTLTGSDADDDTITFPSATAEHGSATITGDELTYTPATDWDGTDTVTYTVNDGRTYGDGEGTIAVTVNANGAPAVDAKSAETRTNDPVAVTLTATDPEQDYPLTWTAATPDNGTVSIAGSTLSYQPATDFAGTDTITVTATDTRGAHNTGEVTVTVNANGAPVVVDKTTTTRAGDTDPQVVDLEANDPEGDPIAFGIDDSSDFDGAAAVFGSKLFYQANADFVGTDTVKVRAQDDRGGVGFGTVDFIVNAAPVVENATATVQQGDDVDVELTATDGNGDDLTWTAATPEHGTVAVDGSTLTYTATDEDFAGDVEITVTADDGQGGTDTGTVTISVNAAPVVDDKSATVQQGGDVTVDLTASEDDVDWTIVTPIEGATIDGSTLTYAAADDAPVGDVEIEVKADDGQGGTDTGTVTITVNAAPVVEDATAKAQQDASVEVDLAATDANGDDLTWTAATPEHGTVAVDGSTLTYTATDEGFAGDVEITVTADDGQGGTDSGIVTITVNGAPVVQDATGTVQQGNSVDLALTATDAEDDPITWSVIDGDATVEGSTLTYDAADDAAVGDVRILVKADDGQGGTDTGFVTITVTKKPNTPPVVQDAAGNAQQGGSVDVDLVASDADGDTVTLTAVKPAHGTATIEGSTLTYTGDADFAGTDTVTVTGDDGQDGVTTGTVTITVNGTPVVNDVSGTVQQGGSVAVTLTATDHENDDITWTAAAPEHGTVALDGSALTYTADDEFAGDVEITVTANDGQGGTSTGTVTITVNGAPVVSNATGTVVQGHTVNVPLTVTDANGDSVTLTAAKPAHGTATVDGSTLTYKADANYAGTDKVTVTADDGHGATSTGTVTVTVKPVATTSAKVTVSKSGTAVVNVACTQACSGWVQLRSDKAGTQKSSVAYYKLSKAGWMPMAFTNVNGSGSWLARVSTNTPNKVVQFNGITLVKGTATANVLKTTTSATVSKSGRVTVNVACTQACSGWVQLRSDAEGTRKSNVVYYKLAKAGWMPLKFTGVSHTNAQWLTRVSIQRPTPAKGQSPVFLPLKLTAGK